jgi:hypothetical protein
MPPLFLKAASKAKCCPDILNEYSARMLQSPDNALEFPSMKESGGDDGSAMRKVLDSGAHCPAHQRGGRPVAGVRP